MINTINLKDVAVFELPNSMMQGKKAPSSLQLATLPIKRKQVFNFRKYALTANEFEAPEYNFYEMSQAEDADGIIRRAVQKKRALAVKQGFSYVGKNNATVDYIYLRMVQISIAQGVPMELLVKDTIGDLVRYHNAFWFKLRDENNSGGRLRMVRTYNGVKELKPVAAYFRIAPETMRIKNDKYGNPIAYMQQMPDGRTKEYKRDDVIHFVFNKRAGMNFATPGLLPAIDDVRALRRIEENVELLVEQYLFPLFTLTIGTDEFPAEVYEDNTTEIDIWSKKLEEMPVSGGIVVGHRHKFDALGFEKSLDVSKYLEHFKKRAFASAGVSNLDMGEGDGMNRSTADNASKILIEDVKDYQQEFQIQFNYEVLNELLLERFSYNVLMPENSVTLEFEEIDTESMIKTENHSALMYSMHAITEDEMRLRGRKKVIDNDDERQKMFLNRYEIPKLEAETKSAKEINAAKPKTGSSTSKAKNKAKNKQQPSNQHGTKSGPSKRKSSMAFDENKFMLFFDDLKLNDPDLTTFQLTNYIFSLDLKDFKSDYCLRLLEIIDQFVQESYLSLEDNSVDEVSLKDSLLLKVSTAIQTILE